MRIQLIRCFLRPYDVSVRRKVGLFSHSAWNIKSKLTRAWDAHVLFGVTENRRNISLETVEVLSPSSVVQAEAKYMSNECTVEHP